KVVWMNCADERPVFQLFTCIAEILQGLLVEKLYLAHCARRSHEPGNVVNDLAPREFSRTQGFLSPLAILDVHTSSVPLEDVARFIPQRIATNQEPSICSVESANASFRVNRPARSQTQLPLLNKFLAVVGMNRFRPPPALRLFRSHAGVIQPYLVEEVAVAV